MIGVAEEPTSSAKAWRRFGPPVLTAVTVAGLLALGLVLIGIIAEPETLLVEIVRWILGK